MTNRKCQKHRQAESAKNTDRQKVPKTQTGRKCQKHKRINIAKGTDREDVIETDSYQVPKPQTGIAYYRQTSRMFTPETQ